MAANGRSLITSVGIQDSTVWVHDAQGEHQISSEGSAGAPQFSPDSQKLYYLRAYGQNASLELWVNELASGASKPVLSGYSLGVCGVGTQHYALSHDGTEIAFSMQDKSGQSNVWIAPTDGRSAPRQIESKTSEDCPFFLPNGDLVFRAAEGEENFLYRVKSDGTGRRKISDEPIFDFYGVSPDGRWALAVIRGSDNSRPYSVVAFPIDGGQTVPVCLGLCPAIWDRSGKSLYLYFPNSGDKNTYILPLQHTGLPILPPAGISSSEELSSLKVPVVAQKVFESGGTPLLYAYTRSTVRRNLYRLPLP